MTTSEQARADALADAETLFRIAPLYQPRAVLGCVRHHAHGGLRLLQTDPERAVAAFTLAARAAFRAVPGLRRRPASRTSTTTEKGGV